MRKFQLHSTVLWVMVIAVASPARCEEKAEPGLAGTWRLESMSMEGSPLMKDKGKTRLVFFPDGEFVMRFGQEVIHGTYEVETDGKPPKMDQKIANGTVAGLKGQTLLCIYEVDGDTLRLVRAGAGRERATEFATKAGSGHALQIYKREKP